VSEPLRCALVGCGAIADAHVEAIRRNPATRLVAGVDPATQARERAGTAWGCPTFSSVEEMLHETDVDAAWVCAPPALHRRLAGELLAAGIHVLCEKPLATTLADAEAMVADARTHGRLLLVSAKFRFAADLLEARRLIDAGAIGEPVYYEVTFCARVPMAGRWNVRPELSGGGVVMDNAPHALDVLGTVLDSDIVRVRAAFSRPTIAPEVEDTAELQLQTERGTLARVALSWTYFTKDLDYLMVQGTEGALRVAWTGGLRRRHGERDWTPFGHGYNKHAAFGQQLDAVLALVRGERDASPFGDPVRAVSLIEEAYRAEREGGWRATRVTPRLAVGR
jgi:predicted dehydrogenase